MPIPFMVFRQRAPFISRVVQLRNASYPNTLLHMAAEALLQGWGVRTDEYKFLDQGWLVITEEETADGPPTTLR